ncbi:MAG: oxidoreductase [Candidatus Lumbricidophila eiseniae]|uniref:Oxidoreductase n=1 Tax=Candidatus Lumbricidiphila eiseniae TaxID=1969409 RepID=A0A2A6FNP3_9MICO|nr:MAG: oxidoreductase [Candidatus Lumbricidophila eiseniae]
MSERLRWGILATGGIARKVTGDLLANGFTVAAVGSRSLAKAEAFAAECGISRAHGSYRELTADPGVDAVYVATPHPLHADNALLALTAGKHVLVEKPFTLNAEQAQAVATRAAQTQLVVREAMWTRYLPHMVRVHEIIAAGTLGEVRTLIANHTQLLSSDPAHRINAPELGGGALLDLGIYPVSFAWDLFGEPSSVRAAASFGTTGVDSQVVTVLTYSSGQVASLCASHIARGPNIAMLLGSEARIEIDSVWYQLANFRVIANDGTVLEEYRSPEVLGTGRHFQFRAFEEIVAAGGDRNPDQRAFKSARESQGRLPVTESVAIMNTLDRVRAQIGLRYPGEDRVPPGEFPGSVSCE